jgi:hypothetical protein
LPVQELPRKAESADRQSQTVLELMAGVVIFIPGAGTTAGAYWLIKVGDQISAEVCK